MTKNLGLVLTTAVLAGALFLWACGSGINPSTSSAANSAAAQDPTTGVFPNFASQIQ